MPCNSDYMGPSRGEIESKKAAQLLVYLGVLSNDNTEPWINEVANSCYGDKSKLDDLVIMLCGKLQNTSDDIIYNGRDPRARQLADWWDNHKAADKARDEKESKDKIDKLLRESALSKLTQDEINSLKLG